MDEYQGWFTIQMYIHVGNGSGCGSDSGFLGGGGCGGSRLNGSGDGDGDRFVTGWSDMFGGGGYAGDGNSLKTTNYREDI